MGQVIKRSSLAIAVVKRYCGRQTEQLTLVLTLGANRVAVSANEVGPIVALRTQIHFGFVGTGFAAGHPEDEDGLAIDVIGSGEGMVMRLYGGMPQIE